MNTMCKLSIAGALSVAAGFAFPVGGAVAGPVGIADAANAVSLPTQVESVYYYRSYYGGGGYCPLRVQHYPSYYSSGYYPSSSY